MLETAMGRAGINEIGERQLMNVPKPLKWPGIDRSDFVRRDANEVMNWIADLVLMLRHGCRAS